MSLHSSGVFENILYEFPLLKSIFEDSIGLYITQKYIRKL